MQPRYWSRPTVLSVYLSVTNTTVDVARWQFQPPLPVYHHHATDGTSQQLTQKTTNNKLLSPEPCISYDILYLVSTSMTSVAILVFFFLGSPLFKAYMLSIV